MEANELRIGNWVYLGRNIIAIDGIGKDFVFNGSTHWNLDAPNLIKPIPLTEKYLLRFGFERSGLYHVKNQVHIHDEHGWTDTGYEYRFNYTSIKIKHVHQLQNLYFALTGEELTIKE